MQTRELWSTNLVQQPLDYWHNPDTLQVKRRTWTAWSDLQKRQQEKKIFVTGKPLRCAIRTWKCKNVELRVKSTNEQKLARFTDLYELSPFFIERANGPTLYTSIRESFFLIFHALPKRMFVYVLNNWNQIRIHAWHANKVRTAPMGPPGVRENNSTAWCRDGCLKIKGFDATRAKSHVVTSIYYGVY